LHEAQLPAPTLNGVHEIPAPAAQSDDRSVYHGSESCCFSARDSITGVLSGRSAAAQTTVD
jgi:hypothetical protein